MNNPEDKEVDYTNYESGSVVLSDRKILARILTGMTEVQFAIAAILAIVFFTKDLPMFVPNIAYMSIVSITLLCVMGYLKGKKACGKTSIEEKED